MTDLIFKFITLEICMFTQNLHYKQYVTQGQFLCWLNSVFLLLDCLKNPVNPTIFTHCWRKMRWIYAFSEGISTT